MTTESVPSTTSPKFPIQASELAQYGFCHRAWWLGAVKGTSSTNTAALDKGTLAHRRHADKVKAAFRWRYAGLVFLGVGCFTFIMTIVFSIV